ncbi:claudin-15-like [Sphaerodactylus townsendi]|uniref:claudin-15-like n=1 Tax=Sphaerodactylus townsendi TaxID=933632 RepID=UPI002026BD0D|nr:claudin-15-like [Sphaerodactylus townsendi]
MSVILEIAGFLFCISGWIMVGAVLSNSYWKVSSNLGSVITSSTIYENLWRSCAEDSTGVSNCREFDTLLALPAYIQACRALMVISLILGLFGVLVTVFGLECTQLGHSNKYTKAKIATTGGMLFILSGLSSMVAVSWYASMITAQFFDSLYAGTKYELGHALYIGWAGSLISILGGILVTCSCKGIKKQNHRNFNYGSATTQKANEQLIYNKALETVTSVKDYV